MNGCQSYFLYQLRAQYERNRFQNVFFAKKNFVHVCIMRTTLQPDKKTRGPILSYGCLILMVHKNNPEREKSTFYRATLCRLYCTSVHLCLADTLIHCVETTVNIRPAASSNFADELRRIFTASKSSSDQSRRRRIISAPSPSDFISRFSTRSINKADCFMLTLT